MPPIEEEFDLIDPTDDGDNTPQPAAPQAAQPPAAPAPGDDVDLDIIDDTPPEDRNRTPVSENELEPTQQELEQFSQRDRSTLAKLRQARHDERRARESAERERQAALEYAQALQAQMQQFQQRYNTDAAAAVGALSEAAQGEVDAIKAQLEQAYVDGNAKNVAELTQKMMSATAKLMQLRAYTPPQVQPLRPAGQAPQHVVQSEPDLSQIRPDARALAWKDKNPWFMSDPVMTNAAYGVHEKLVRVDRLDPNVEPDEYYGRLDAQMREMFPKYTWSNARPTQAPQAQPRSAAPVAGVSRNVANVSQRNGKTVVQLTKSQLNVAQSLGISPKAYAAELLRLSKQENA